MPDSLMYKCILISFYRCYRYHSTKVYSLPAINILILIVNVNWSAVYESFSSLILEVQRMLNQFMSDASI